MISHNGRDKQTERGSKIVGEGQREKAIDRKKHRESDREKGRESEQESRNDYRNREAERIEAPRE